MKDQPVLNGWSILPPAIDETNNRIIYLIGTIAVSGSDFSIIQTIDWGTPKLHNKIPENGAPAIHIELTNDSETVPSELDGSGALFSWHRRSDRVIFC